MATSLFELIDDIAGLHATRPALVSSERVVTYDSLRRQVRVLAAELAGRGVRQQDRVGLMAPNSVEFVIAYLAGVAAGAIVVPLNEHYAQKEIQYFIDECDISLLITTELFRPLCDEVLPRARKRSELLFVEDWGNLDRDIDWVPPAIDPDAPVMYQFSSGSTGRPKRIARTHRNLIFELNSLVETVGLRPEDRFVGAAPFSHVNGLMRSMLSSLRAGASLYPVAHFDRKAVAELIARDQLTVFIAVPFMFISLAQTNFARTPDWRSLRLCVSASAPLPAKYNREFHAKFGQYVRQLYGSTETGTISINLLLEIGETLESVGRPISGVRVAVLGEDGQPVEAGKVGEVAVASPGAITGYAGMDEQNRQSFRHGYFLTGDLGRLDPDGMLYLHGRIKFQINKGGFKIDPREIEEVLEGHPCVSEVVVFGVPTAYGDEKVKAMVVQRAPCAESELLEYLTGKIANFKIPSVIEFCSDLPKSSTGKIRRGLLTDMK